MSEATARPWRACGSARKDCECRQVWATEADVKVAVAMTAADEHYTGGAGVDDRDEAKANAALIVKAVNAHDALVAACELAAEHEECVCEGKGECLGCVLQAALKGAQR